MKNKLVHLRQEKSNGACEKLSNAVLRTVQNPGTEACQKQR